MGVLEYFAIDYYVWCKLVRDSSFVTAIQYFRKIVQGVATNELQQQKKRQ